MLCDVFCRSTRCLLVLALIPAALHAVFEIDAAEEHFEGFGFEVDFCFGLVVGTGTGEATSLKAFHQYPKSRAIPVEHFDAVGALVEEDEEFGGKWVFLELFFDDAAEGIEAFAEVAGLGGEADFDAVGEDHGWVVAWDWMRRVRPPGKVSSTSSLRGGFAGRAGSSSSMKGAGAAADNFCCRVCRRHRKKVW